MERAIRRKGGRKRATGDTDILSRALLFKMDGKLPFQCDEVIIADDLAIVFATDSCERHFIFA